MFCSLRAISDTGEVRDTPKEDVVRTYLYDGTFEGLLTVFHRLFGGKERPLAIRRRNVAGQGFLGETLDVETDSSRADSFCRAMERRLSSVAVRVLYLAHLSEEENMEMRLFEFVHLGGKRGRLILEDLGESRVATVMKMAARVERERELFLGLVRFREVGVFSYAPIEPVCRLLPLLGGHFALRFPAMKWMIHDVGRKEAIVHDEEGWYFAPCEFSGGMEFALQEKHYQCLWKTYFSAAAVENRKNPERQRGRMPKKYWKWLVEVPLEKSAFGE